MPETQGKQPKKRVSAKKKPAAKKKKAVPKKTGRPSEFTQAIADAICERIADGESLRKICAEETMPNKATVFRWMAVHKEFSDQYARAREEQAELLADEIIEIADDGRNDKYIDPESRQDRVDHDVIARSRLRVEARKWVAAKLKPKKYGDKVAIGGADDLPPVKSEVDLTINPEEAYLRMIGKQ